MGESQNRFHPTTTQARNSLFALNCGFQAYCVCQKESANGFSFWLNLFSVIPAQAGTQGRDVVGLIPIFSGFLPFSSFTLPWVPACAGMTNRGFVLGY
jgi:hypothetical protein